MSFAEILRMSWQNIRNNMLRAVLTMLIIAFGIMALVGILTAIDSLAYSLNDSFSGLGANSFVIERKGGEMRGRHQKIKDPIDIDQASTFKERFNFPAKVSLAFSATGLAQVKYGQEESNPNIELTGIDENYFDVKGMDIAFGRNFTYSEAQSIQNRVVIGYEIVKVLFNDKPESAIDKVISIGNAKYLVIGVLATKGSTMNSSNDRAVFVPLQNARAQYANANSEYAVIVAVDDANNMDAAISEASGLFRSIRRLKPGQEDDFEMFTSNSIAGILKENTTNLQLATIAIGLMTLLGAAIGLMNIMLVSVTERTKEIGIYKALGATSRDIMLQFLTEAVLICQSGGVLGILMGIMIGNALPLILGGKFLVPWVWIMLGFIICMVVGVLSGFYPAMKAARLDPIESLRYE
jgi:putative ABC transport system permease protein